MGRGAGFDRTTAISRITAAPRNILFIIPIFAISLELPPRHQFTVWESRLTLHPAYLHPGILSLLRVGSLRQQDHTWEDQLDWVASLVPRRCCMLLQCTAWINVRYATTHTALSPAHHYLYTQLQTQLTEFRVVFLFLCLAGCTRRRVAGVSGGELVCGRVSPARSE